MSDSVSIVIIGRNEEFGIGKCLAAAGDAAEQIGGAEILFVDSASTDRTVQIVRSRGVRVLSLKPEWRLTPSAGRYVGAHYAGGDYILFVDADTLVYRDFLPAAIEHFRNNPEVGGVGGRIDDLDEQGEILSDVEDRFERATDAKWLRGPCCFYRQTALRKVGSFNPHLAVEEEAELGLRLLKNNWKLQILPIPMACHTRCYHMQTFESVVSIFKRDVVAGRLGEVTRTIGYAHREGYGLEFCRLRLQTTIVFLAWLLLVIACLFLPANFYPKSLSFLTTILGLLAVYVKKRSVGQTLLFAVAKALTFVDLLAGLPKIFVKDTNSYPLDVVQHSPQVSDRDDRQNSLPKPESLEYAADFAR